VAVPLFLVHSFGSDFGMFEEGLLIPFAKDRVLVVIVLFEVKVGWVTLIDDTSNMITIDLTDVRCDR
jgi:hypothetical protein